MTPRLDNRRERFAAYLARPDNRILALRDFALLLVERFIHTRCPQVAGSLTFTTLLAIVPLLTVSIALFSNFPAFSELGRALSAFLQNNVLPEAAGQIATYAIQFSEKATNLTLIGTVMLIVTVLLLLHTIDDVFNDIWGVRHPRPLLTRITVYWVALTLGPITLAGSVFATGQLVATSIEFVGASMPTRTFAATAVPVGLLGGLLSFLYFAVPNHPVKSWHALIGGFSAAIAFIWMQKLFGLFIMLTPTYTLVYGAFAALPIFLVWLYASWVVILLGAILAATFPEYFERKRTVRAFPGDQAWASLNMLLLLTDKLDHGETTAFEALRERASTSSDQTEHLLGEMREAGWVTRSEDETWVLTRHPAQLRLTDVLQRFALSPDQWLNAAENDPASVKAAGCILSGFNQADMSLAELHANDGDVRADPLWNTETSPPGQNQIG